MRANARNAKLGEVAAEFEAIHNIQRAQNVGSVHHIVPAAELRPQRVAAIERGMARSLDALSGCSRSHKAPHFEISGLSTSGVH